MASAKKSSGKSNANRSRVEVRDLKAAKDPKAGKARSKIDLSLKGSQVNIN